MYLTNKVALMALLPVALPIVANAATEAKRPNILWIVTDDQRADALGCWNEAMTGKKESALGYVSSPNIDRIASQGVLFTHSYCNSPLSGPSRGSMHTGQYPHHNGMYNFQMKHQAHDMAKPIVPEVMREAGYQTTAFGKVGYYIYEYKEPMTFHYSDGHYEQLITERNIERAGFSDFNNSDFIGLDGYTNPLIRRDEFFFPDGHMDSYLTHHPSQADQYTPVMAAKRDSIRQALDIKVTPKSWFGEIIGGVSTMPTEKTQDARIAQETCMFLDNRGEDYTSLIGLSMSGPSEDKPQFVYAGFHFPHSPVLPSKEYRDQFMDKDYTLPEYEKSDMDGMPAQIMSWWNSHNLESFSHEEQVQMIRDYYAFCAMGDELLGRTVDHFIKYSEDNDEPYLVIIATGDHGWHLGEQGCFFKNINFMKSNQTATIVVSSDKETFPAGKIVHDNVEYVDFAPTIYAAAGVDLDEEEMEFLDGRDLALTSTSAVEPRDYVLGITQTRAFMRGEDFAFSMRSTKRNGNPSFKDMPNSEVKWPLECSVEEAELALFDLRVDPGERRNVANDPEYKDLAAWFRTKLGNIVLGDDRLEVIWSEKNVYDVSSFAKGSDDKRLDIPSKLIPKVKKIKK